MTTESYVQVGADGTGKKVDSALVTLADGTQQYRQVIAIGDSVGSNFVMVSVDGTLYTRNDALDGQLTLTNRLLAKLVLLLSTMGDINITDVSPEDVL